MVHESEVLLFVLGSGLLIAILINLKGIAPLPHYRFLIAGYVALYFGWFFTILEGFLLPDILNGVEHVCYTLSMIFVAMWSTKMFLRKERA